jgi:hypothetical protein
MHPATLSGSVGSFAGFILANVSWIHRSKTPNHIPEADLSDKWCIGSSGEQHNVSSVPLV